MGELIKCINIEGFRCFSKLIISEFGKVNLITGKNNTGKSSLLEAIRILLNRGSQGTLRAILNYREENNDPDRETLKNDFDPYCSLFTGLPKLSEKTASFSVGVSGDFPVGISTLSVTATWVIRRSDPETGRVSYETTPDMFDSLDDGMPALEIRMGDRSRMIPLHKVTPFEDISPERIRSVYLDPFSSRTTSELGIHWDAIVLTDTQNEVIKALKLISPDIEAVSMIERGGPRLRARTAIVKSQRFDTPVPLRTFGDGVTRLFGIILALCNARDGVLLIDEFENGLHHSVQPSIWKTIFRLARDLNVQVFATSHSLDCVRAFHEADSDEAGVLIRLTRTGETVLPTTFKGRDLKIAIQNDMEVR